MRKPPSDKRTHYVDNKEFLKAMVAFRTEVKEAEESGAPRPRVPEYIGSCFMQIGEHLSYKPNFINYTFRHDMISDGVENCLQYIDNFNPEKSKNPFAYFTQVIYFAFLRRIEKEKKQIYIRYKATEASAIPDQLATGGETGGITQKLYDNQQDFVRNFEERLAEKKRKSAEKKGLEKFEKKDATEELADWIDNQAVEKKEE